MENKLTRKGVTDGAKCLTVQKHRTNKLNRMTDRQKN